MFRAQLDAAIELVFPTECLGCGAPSLRVCETCASGLLQPITWSIADVGLVHASGHYSRLLRELVIARKAHGDRGVLPALGQLAARALASAGAGLPVVPVPASARALRSRGANVVAELAAAAGVRVVELLEVCAAPRDQVGLSGPERAANLAGAFGSVRTGSGDVVLLDDVVTTGSTVREARRALHAAGFTVRGVATVAIAGEDRRRGLR